MHLPHPGQTDLPDLSAEAGASGSDQAAAARGDSLDAALAHLADELREATSGDRIAAVAFSGGADSAFVLAACARALGPDRVVAVTAVSPSLAEDELAQARAFASSLGVRHLLPASEELERPGYRENSTARCFHCKTEVISVVHAEAERLGTSGVVVMTGTNADDLVSEHRPGIVAARRLGAITPIGGLTKAQVREASRRWGLRTWDKPAQACLASRIAYGVTVTADALMRVQRSEASLRALFAERGWPIADVRVRDRGEGSATIEVDRDWVAAVSDDGGAVERVTACGFADAVVDPVGFRSGSLNEVAQPR